MDPWAFLKNKKNCEENKFFFEGPKVKIAIFARTFGIFQFIKRERGLERSIS